MRKTQHALVCVPSVNVQPFDVTIISSTEPHLNYTNVHIKCLCHIKINFKLSRDTNYDIFYYYEIIETKLLFHSTYSIDLKSVRILVLFAMTIGYLNKKIIFFYPNLYIWNKFQDQSTLPHFTNEQSLIPVSEMLIARKL